MANESLANARRARNDEFYTQYADIQNEMNSYLAFDADVFRDKVVLLPCDDPEWSNFTKYFAENFDKLGMKKLISTSYAPDSKPKELNLQLAFFETESPKFDKKKARTNGRIFTLERDRNGDKKINFDDIEWDYLGCYGDFRSDEVRALRDQADIIITNPPFSLFREFLTWIVDANKKFVIIGNMNAITYKEVFPLIMNDKIWLGATGNGSDMVFGVPEGSEVRESDRVKAERLGYKGNYTRLGNSCWFTNLDHGSRHKAIPLMTKADNKKFSKHKEVKGVGYQKYDNYDAIDVSFTNAIPSDYDGVMGVPISFLSKYSPEQFEILGCTESEGKGFSNGLWHKQSGVAQALVGGERIYKRIFVRHRGPSS